MSLDISVKVDPSQAVPAADKVVAALDKIEAAGPKVGAAIARGMRQGSTEMDKARAAAEPLTNAFRGLTDQIGREAAMLERLHGPMIRAEQDLKTLEMLHKRGAVTARQYSDELARIGKSAGLSRGNPMDAVSLPSMPGPAGGGGAVDGLANGIMGMVAPAALAATAIGAIGDAFTRWQTHRDLVNEATNSILKFHQSFEMASAAMVEQKQLADDLHMNLGKTTKAYADVREATEGMFLTSSQQVDVTRNLTAALVADGGAVEDVTAIMGKFQLAMELGTMSTRDLTTIARKSPEVLNMMMESTGKTYAELQKMAKEEKITTDVMMGMVAEFGNGTAAMDKYSERAITSAEATRMMVDGNLNMVETIRALQKAQEPYVASLPTMAELFERNVNASLRLNKTLEEVKNSMADTSAFAAFAAVQITMADALAQANKDFSVQADILEKLRGPRKSYHDQVDNLNAMLRAGTIDQAEFNRSLADLNGPSERAAKGLSAYTREVNAYAEAVRRANTPQYNGEQPDAISGGAVDNGSFPNGWNIKQQPNPNVPSAPVQLGEGYTQATNASIEASKQLKDEIVSINDIFADELVNSAQSFSDNLVDAANGADVSWSAWGENMLDSLQKAIAKALILKAITGAVDGSKGAGGYGGLLGLLGGATGFDSRVPGGPGPFLPGFAQGGDFTVGGAGSTDSKVAMFRVTPGETVHVRTPQQQKQASASSGPAPVNIVVQDRNPRALMQGGRDAHRVVLDAIRDNPGAIRALLR